MADDGASDLVDVDDEDKEREHASSWPSFPFELHPVLIVTVD